MIDTKELVIILDPRGVISSDEETLKRHISYGARLASLDAKKKLVIFSAFKKENKVITPNNMELLFVPFSRIPISFSRSIAKKIKSEFMGARMVFIAGDPWESFLTYKLVMWKLKKSFPIQVQVHSELANPKWYLARIPNFLKFLVSRIALRQSNQIRTVSKIQQKDILLKFNLHEEKFRLIPPPLNINTIPQSHQKIRPRSLGFVGRISKDRGTRTFVKFCKDLSLVDDSFVVEIAGVGPDRNFLQNSLLSILGEHRVRFHGHLDSAELSKFWINVGVLVSLSKTESYGRTIREAAFTGVPVWSTETSGFRQLSEESSEFSLATYSKKMQPSDLLSIFDKLLLSYSRPLPRNSELELNDNRIKELCHSWIELFELRR